nr:protein kinase-like domain, phloem protein 2-like protein [Tanacetum cinerariifolium]
MAVSRDINLDMSYEDIYTSLHRGILLRNNNVWFSIGENGERVERISTVEFKFEDWFHAPDRRFDGEFISRSRFGFISKKLDSSSLNIQIKLKPQLLSPGVNYGVYLLYMFEKFRESSNECMELTYKIGNKYSRSHYTKDTADGWSMIRLYQFPNLKDGADIDIFVKGFSESHRKNEAIFLEGVEFRAINNMTHEEIKELEKVNMGGHIMQFLLCLREKCCAEKPTVESPAMGIDLGTNFLLVFIPTKVTDIHKRTKTKTKKTKPSTGLEEREKTKPKAYASLMDQPIPILLGQTPIGGLNVECDLRVQMDDWEFVIDQGLRLKAKDAPHHLEASLRCYK